VTGCPANCLACATGSPRYAPAERKPSVGWKAPDGQSIDRDEAFGWTLAIASPPGGVGWSGSGRHRACVRDEEGSIVLRIQARDVLSIRWVTIWDDVMDGTATNEATRAAAQFAAEDALLEIASGIVGAVRR
jgi:hypothetical protein